MRIPPIIGGLLLTIMLTNVNLAHASQARIFLGTYTNARDIKGIYTCTLDLATGKLGPVELAAEAFNPSYLAIAPNGKYLYSADEGPQGQVTSFRVDRGGTLTKINEREAGGGATCHVWVDPTGRNVLAANYGTGSISSFPIMPDGSLGPRSAFVQFSGSGPNPSRQTAPHAHSVYTDAKGHFVYCCDLGTDNIWIYKYDAERGAIDYDSVQTARVPPGGGPRHLAFHPNGNYAYVNNEMGLTVSVFERNAASGALSIIQNISTVPEGTSHAQGASTAEIAIHPSGKWLYVSNRGADTIAVYEINPDGKLTRIEYAKSIVEMPRGFAIDPTGRWLVAAGQKDNRITVLEINQGTGHLTPTDQIEAAGCPVCVIFQ